jgi:hypothetical protein
MRVLAPTFSATRNQTTLSPSFARRHLRQSHLLKSYLNINNNNIFRPLGEEVLGMVQTTITTTVLMM